MKIGIFGLGNVGGGVIEILGKSNSDIKIKKVCVRDLKKQRDFNLPENCEVVADIHEILNDSEIETVVELVGGTTVAWEIVKTAIQKNKNVITANKALIAKYLPQLQNLLAKHPMVNFAFEAAVGGGIPIIHTLQRDLVLDQVLQISGIINGTTNFILSKMEKEGVSYDIVLKEAQSLGYAEADPTADVGGFDARSKILILAKLAFGADICEEFILTKGITEITDTDFAYAKSFGSTIKLLAVAEKCNDQISIFVSPVLLPVSNILANVDGATNAIAIQSENLKQTILIGQGAGRFPTANAVVSDVIAMMENKCLNAFVKNNVLVVNNDLNQKFYIRFQVKDELGIVEKIGKLCAENNISINAISQLPIGNHENLPFILITEKSNYSAVQKMCEKFSEEACCIEIPFFMQIFN